MRSSDSTTELVELPTDMPPPDGSLQPDAAPDPTTAHPTFAIVICLFASLGGMFFGYGQGIAGGELVMRSFLDDFCEHYDGNSAADCRVATSKLPQNWLTFTTLFNVLSYVGCVFGALGGGFVADRCGRRASVFVASLLFTGGTVWVLFSPAQGHAVVLVGRVVQGSGVGMASFAVPLFAAEMAPKELRGLLSGFMQMMVVTGLLLANIVNYALANSSIGWRISNAVATVPPLVLMLGIFCFPESPRWIYKHRSRDTAFTTLRKLRRSDAVMEELDAIGDQLAVEGGAAASWSHLLERSVRQRLLIAMTLQLLQQATGINPVFTYGGQIFGDVVGNGIVSLIVLTAVNFVSTIPAMRWVDTYGRRQLLLVGAAGMFLGHMVAAVTFLAGCAGDTEHAQCSKAAGIVIVLATAFFVANFAVSWGPVCWIYPAEIFPLSVRAKAVSVSTMTNWSVGALMIAIPKLFPYLNVYGVFFLFAGLTVICGLFVFFMCPETKGVMLEEIEALFDGSPRRSKHSASVTATGNTMYYCSVEDTTRDASAA